MTGHHHRLPKRDREWRRVAQSKLAPHKLLQHDDVPESVVCFQTGRATKACTVAERGRSAA